MPLLLRDPSRRLHRWPEADSNNDRFEESSVPLGSTFARVKFQKRSRVTANETVLAVGFQKIFKSEEFPQRKSEVYIFSTEIAIVTAENRISSNRIDRRMKFN